MCWLGLACCVVLCSVVRCLTSGAETDGIFTVAKRHETEEILTKKEATYQVFLYSGVEHGFAVKGHMSTAKARFAKEQAFLQAVAWFDQYVKKDKSML